MTVMGGPLEPVRRVHRIMTRRDEVVEPLDRIAHHRAAAGSCTEPWREGSVTSGRGSQEVPPVFLLLPLLSQVGQLGLLGVESRL